MNFAIAYNNICVISLNQRNFSEAERAAKRAVTLVEPLIAESMKQQALKKAGSAFLQQCVQVLLIGYYNISKVH